MDKTTIDILYAFLTLCRNVSKKNDHDTFVHWGESKIILTGGTLRDTILGVKPVDYDIHIYCDSKYTFEWKRTFKKIEKMSYLFGTEIFKFTNSSASLNPTGISASFNILFRGIIIDVFVRSSSKNDIIPPVPFFIVNSCYTVLKEINSRFEHIYNYSYHNHKESNSYIIP